MQIIDGFFKDAKKITTLGVGQKMAPTFIVIHYTAGSSLSGAVTTLQAEGYSYNILINKDGSIHQARALDRTAAHAGRSNWKSLNNVNNLSSLNANSIGISLVNLGMYPYFSEGKWWYGYDKGTKKFLKPSVADPQANKKSSIYAPGRSLHWEPYPAAQIEACRRVVASIVANVPTIEEIVGHDDIAIDGKSDPGPDFPMENFRQQFAKTGGLGLSAKVKSPDGVLILRDRAGHLDGKEVGRLTNGDIVHVRSVTYVGGSSGAALVPSPGNRALSAWASVDTTGTNRHAGFVHMRYLDRTPLDAPLAAKL